jgi:hypothetical protein
MAGERPLIAAALGLRADAVTLEILRVLRAISIEPILLRGPALSRLLYAHEADRSYGDVDLLVRFADLVRAETALSGLGFDDRTVEGMIDGDRPAYAHTWVRPRDGGVVDLHFTLQGVQLAPAVAWETWAQETEPLALGGVDVAILTTPGRLVVVALHAAGHGARVGKPLEDLRRAVERLPYESWELGRALAARLEATEAFATGLRLLPAGRELADRLALPHTASVETVLRARTPPPTALGFEWLARTPTVRGKVTLIVRKIAPDSVFMRARWPVARRGSIGLAAAYIWRVLWLMRHTPSGLHAWSRARKPTNRL